MKKTVCLIVSFIFAFVLAVPCFAQVDSPYMIDNADLLSDYEEQYLLTEIENLRSEYGYDIIIHTTYDTEGKDIISYCDDYYDEGGYAEDGLIFVISMAERDYYTSTCGTLVDSLPDYQIDYICASVTPYLSEGSYFAAFEEYLRGLNSYFGGYESGEISPDIHYGDYYGDDYYYSTDDYYYTDNYQPSVKEYAIREFVVILVAFIIAFIITTIIKSKMNTAVKQRDADSYVVDGSFVLNGQRDAFVGTHTARRAIPKNNNTNHGGRVGGGGIGGGGGHISSGGVRHGGSGGKF